MYDYFVIDHLHAGVWCARLRGVDQTAEKRAPKVHESVTSVSQALNTQPIPPQRSPREG
jgi:hypothetical protein